MKIIDIGFYRTRGGKVAFVSGFDESYDKRYPVKGCIINVDTECWTKHGSYLIDETNANDLVELIKPYSEELLK